MVNRYVSTFNYEISGLDMSCSCIHSKHTDQDKVEATEEDKVRKAANCRRDKLRWCIYFGSETDEQRENRIIKQRERSRKNLASKTAEQTRILKQENNRKQRGEIGRSPTGYKPATIFIAGYKPVSSRLHLLLSDGY